MNALTIFVCSSLFLSGCGYGERISNLEKQNQDLRTEVKRSSAVADFDLAEKCSRDARAWFNTEWSRDKATMLLDFTNHYNKARNKCFITIEWHYRLNPNGESWVNDIMLYDVYENEKLGSISVNHLVSLRPEYSFTENVYGCEVWGQKCKTLDEFNKLTTPYMSD
jgi:hypothetical protein